MSLLTLAEHTSLNIGRALLVCTAVQLTSQLPPYFALALAYVCALLQHLDCKCMFL